MQTPVYVTPKYTAFKLCDILLAGKDGAIRKLLGSATSTASDLLCDRASSFPPAGLRFLHYAERDGWLQDSKGLRVYTASSELGGHQLAPSPT